MATVVCHPWSRAMVFNLKLISQFPGGLVKAQSAGPYPQSFCSSRSGVRQRMHISNKFPGNADSVGPGTTLREPLV